MGTSSSGIDEIVDAITGETNPAQLRSLPPAPIAYFLPTVLGLSVPALSNISAIIRKVFSNV
ncbi:hypothetical protein PtB15_8B608 [Puccinia triticina]|nr:hypothetical protein PtB15_8B608 [Puccinia triticina]